MMQLQNKTIWLTGASSGIGLALLHKLLANNNRVFASARDIKSLVLLAEKHPSLLFPIPCDVTDSWSVAAAATQIGLISSSLDIVILNAGICEYIDATNFDSALIERVFATNFMGAVKTLEHSLPLLTAGKTKYIVAVSSSAAYLPLPRAEAYGASKAALNYFLESLRVDLTQQGFKVSIVSPGFVKTPLTDKNDFPMPMIIDSDAAANYIYKGMCKQSYEISFPPAFTLTMKCIQMLPNAIKNRVLQLSVRNKTEQAI